jgi:xanthine dehydrogenase molybdenum-binding subunit
MSATYNVIGKSFPRIDAAMKVTGNLPFYDDLHLPGMLYGRVLHSPYARATITAIDTSAAEALKGVVAVVTYKDAPTVPYSTVFNNYVLDTNVRFVGDEVAAVAAIDPYIAEDALDLIKVTYTQLPPLLSVTASTASGAPLLYPTQTGNIVNGAPMTLNFGDAATALSKSDNTLKGSWSSQWEWHSRPNLGGCIADFSTSDMLTIYEGDQGASGKASTLSKMFGVAQDKIHVAAPYTGGTFGASDSGRFDEIAALLSKKAGRPVRLQYTRAEDAMCSSRRHPMFFTDQIGYMNNGHLTAVIRSFYSDVGATGGTGPTGMNRMNTFDFVRFTDGSFTAYPTYTNLLTSGAFRGYGGPQCYPSLGTLLDQAAEKLGMDAVQFLKLNAVQTGDPQPSTLATGRESTISAIDYGACLDMGASTIGWSTKIHPPGKGPVSGTQMEGIGVALGLHECSALGTYPAVIQVKNDGTAVVYCGNADMGQGLRTSLAAMAAEAMGMNYADIWVNNGDSMIDQYAPGTAASAACAGAGNSVALAGANALQQMFALAAPVLKVQANQLSAALGTIYQTSTPSNSITIKALMSGYTASNGIVGYYSGAVPTYPSVIRAIGCHFVEVNVDTSTGFVDVLNSVSVWDVGKAINPAVVTGNLVSGSVQGIAFGLTEEGVVDPTTGRLLNPNYYQYGLLTTADDGAYPVGLYVEAPSPLEVYGQKGVGEVGHVSPPAALANAIYNAIGIRFTSSPITPAKILQALGKA